MYSKMPTEFFFQALDGQLLCVILQFIHISYLSKSLSSTLSLHGFRGARTAFSESALMRDIVLFDMPVSLLAPSLQFDDGANSTPFTMFMASFSRSFKITCVVTRILYRVCDSHLSGLRSKKACLSDIYTAKRNMRSENKM